MRVCLLMKGRYRQKVKQQDMCHPLFCSLLCGSISFNLLSSAHCWETLGNRVYKSSRSWKCRASGLSSFLIPLKLFIGTEMFYFNSERLFLVVQFDLLKDVEERENPEGQNCQIRITVSVYFKITFNQKYFNQICTFLLKPVMSCFSFTKT